MGFTPLPPYGSRIGNSPPPKGIPTFDIMFVFPALPVLFVLAFCASTVTMAAITTSNAWIDRGRLRNLLMPEAIGLLVAIHRIYP